jgi:fructose-bisphosphate aldolase class II
MGIDLFLPLKSMIAMAQARRVCIPAFDIGGGRLEFIQAVLQVARAEDAPALFISYVGSAKQTGFRPLVAMVRALAEEAGVPAALQLDHAAEEADVRAAIAGGFLDVMFDASRSSLDENVARTREVVAYAHAHGVSVEAAFGAIGREGGNQQAEELTDPALAARFVEETGVDLLTPSVGNRHGCRGFTVPLEWDLMKELRARIPVPMALHGGSGIAVEDMSQAGGLGFHKVNVATVLHAAYNEAVKGYIQEHPEHGWFRWAQAGREAVRNVVERYVTGLGLRGLAGDLAKGR